MMRCLYRERRYECGNYLEVDIYPVFRKQKGRRKKSKPTSEVQAKLNEHNAEQQLIRILNENFNFEDIEIHLTYRNENLPDTPEEAERDVQNYIRRVKRLRRKLGLPEMKYVNVPAGGVDGTRFHFHITMTGGIDRSTLEELWGYGYANSKKLQFCENGIEGLARYVSRQFREHKGKVPFKKRWTASRNLVIPKPKDRDGKLSQKKVQELATFDAENREAFEKLYPGYFFSGCSSFHNEVNKGYYLCVRMYRKDAQFSNTKKRRQSNSS